MCPYTYKAVLFPSTTTYPDYREGQRGGVIMSRLIPGVWLARTSVSPLRASGSSPLGGYPMELFIDYLRLLYLLLS